MPQVPYQPVPDVQPEDRVAQPPRLNIYTNPDMFGANIGRAIEQLGGQLGKSDEELFQRALAIQQIKNQSELDAHLADLTNQTSTIHANYLALRGNNAPASWSKYQQDLENTRAAIQSQASNPTVAREFETASRNQVTRDMTYGARHSAQELSHFQNESIKMRMDANAHATGLDPFDEQGFQQKVATQRELAREAGALQGLDPTDEANKEESRLWRERLTAMGAKDPFTATKKLEDASAAGKIRSDDYARIDKALEYQSSHAGARNISSDLYNGRNTMLGDEKVPIDIAKKAISKIESEGSPREYMLRGPETRLGRALGKYQVMEAELPGQLREAGLPPMTPDQFRANPEAQEKLFATVFGNLMEKYGSFNEAASHWFTGRSVAEAKRTGVRDAFNTDINKYLAVTNAELARNVPLSKLVDVGARTADSVSNNPYLKDNVTHYLTTDRNRLKAVERDAIQQDRDTIADAIRGDYSNGNVPKDIDELSHIPQVQQVINGGRLHGNELNDMAGKLNRYRDAVTKESNQKIKNSLEGLADEEPLVFQGIKDFSEFGLSAKDIGYFEKKQREKRASAEGDPDLRKAYQAIRPMLPIDFDSKDNAATRQEFKGALRGAVIDKMQEKGGKKLTDEEYRDLGKSLLTQQLNDSWWATHAPWWMGGAGTSPWYKAVRNVPQGAKEAIDKDYEDRGLGKPTEEQYVDEYSRERFMKDFGKTKE